MRGKATKGGRRRDFYGFWDSYELDMLSQNEIRSSLLKKYYVKVNYFLLPTRDILTSNHFTLSTLTQFFSSFQSRIK